MFGYILPQKSEMKVREFNQYRATYCGLCKQLGRSYGLTSRFLLNYDLLLLCLIADGISGQQANYTKEGCIANPFEKKWVCGETDGLQLAADCLVLLSYHKLQDDIIDEKLAKRIAAGSAKAALTGVYRRCAAQYSQLDAVLKKQLENQQALENEQCDIPDHAADPTAQMVAAMAVMCSKDTALQPALYRFGLFLGKLIYLLDAADDFDKDNKNGSYNVFLKMGLTKQQMITQAQKHCKIAAAELSVCYCKLPFVQNKSILDNIIYLGLPNVIQSIGCPKKRSYPHYERI